MKFAMPYRVLSVLFALLIVVSLLLVSCTGNTDTGNVTGETTSGTETSGVSQLTLYSRESGSSFKIVRSDTAAQNVIESAKKVLGAFKDKFGAAPEITTDWVKRGDVVPSGTPEILIGATNRQESIDAIASLGGIGYAVKVVGTRVVICAADDSMIEYAVNYFIKTYIEPAADAVIIPGDVDYICTDLDIFREGWLLAGIPAYDGGTLSQALYDAGPGSEWNQAAGAESQMQIISGTSASSFENYIKKLEKNGFTREFYNNVEDNVYTGLYDGSRRVYAYYTDAVSEARVIIDKTSPSLTDFGYTYTKQATDNTVIYQYGLPMAADGSDISVNGNYLNCGHLYLIKLADNSIFLIDGGGSQQFDSAMVDGFMNFLREITGVPAGEKIRISCWYFTHAHSDHFAGACRFFTKYHDELTLERLMFNFPSLTESDLFSGSAGNRNKLFAYIKNWYGANVETLKIHTGMKLNLADVGVEVIYTHEDIVDAELAKSLVVSDYNDTSAVIRVTFDGRTFMILGDINKPSQNIIIKSFSAEYLKSDVVQVSHHTWNSLQDLYNRIKASVALFPQSSGGAVKDSTRIAITNTVKLYARQVYYAGDETVGIYIVDGSIKAVDRRGIIGGKYTGWSW